MPCINCTQVIVNYIYFLKLRICVYFLDWGFWKIRVHNTGYFTASFGLHIHGMPCIENSPLCSCRDLNLWAAKGFTEDQRPKILKVTKSSEKVTLGGDPKATKKKCNLKSVKIKEKFSEGYFWVALSLLWRQPPVSALHYFLATLNFSGNLILMSLFMAICVIYFHNLFERDSPTRSYALHYKYLNLLAYHLTCHFWTESIWKHYFVYSLQMYRRFSPNLTIYAWVDVYVESAYSFRKPSPNDMRIYSVWEHGQNLGEPPNLQKKHQTRDLQVFLKQNLRRLCFFLQNVLREHQEHWGEHRRTEEHQGEQSRSEENRAEPRRT